MKESSTDKSATAEMGSDMTHWRKGAKGQVLPGL